MIEAHDSGEGVVESTKTLGYVLYGRPHMTSLVGKDNYLSRTRRVALAIVEIHRGSDVAYGVVGWRVPAVSIAIRTSTAIVVFPEAWP